ncbi:FecR domain-containing protein [Duganella sp. sic0402]|uniref:FecR family protein n=1 Tax=Duganella sp. sic0402 TaxID=2854786 RepID=UPI0035A2BFA6
MTDDIARQAVQWIVQLSADDDGERAEAVAGFDAWKAADPRHAEMAARMQRIIHQTQTLRGEQGGGVGPAHAALSAAQASGRQRRPKRAIAALALAAALAVPCWLALQSYPPGYLMADLRTGTGEWHTTTLPDGTRITLGSASAVNLRFDTQRRALELVQGEMLVDVSHDANRPFLVETDEGSVRALGTRFVVRNERSATTLSMLESRTLVRTAAQRAHPDPSQPGVAVGAGQRVRIYPNALGQLESIDGRSIEDAWRFHQLVAQGRLLPEVLDELGRHRKGRIQFNRAELQDIKVYAVLPLDDTDRALQLLVDSLPALRVRKFSRYLVMVDAAEEK